MMTKIIIIMLVCAAPHFAQGWDKVQALKPGQEIRVETAQGKQMGLLVEAGSAALRFQPQGGAEISVVSADVQRVYVRKKSNRLRNTLIGAGVGVAVGAVVYGTLGTLFRNETGDEPMLLVAPILIGTGVGAALPSGGMKLVYDAKKK
jgi:hypothetical protein